MANAYIDIYHPEGWIMMQPLITKEAERVEELMQADYAQLSWADTERIEIPAGAFIYDPDTGEQLTLLDPYEPEQKDELEYDYKPIFQSRVMAWGKVPFFHYTYDADGNITAREPDWVLTDNPANFMQAICDAINIETGENGDTWTFEVAGDVIGNSATISFSATDIFSALNQIASEFDTEWLADKDNNTILLGKAMYDRGCYWQLIVGDNVGAPSVTASKEGYYNRFYCFGSTRNITQDYKGASVNNLVNRRLTLSSADYPDGYIDTYREAGTPVFPKILIFDDIYPRSGFTISDLRPRLMYRLNPDDNNSKIQIGTDSDGNPVYDMYTIWYFQIDGFKLNDTTYSKDNPDGMLISGKNLSVHFSSGALTGREFELIYHPSAKRLSNSDGQDFNVKAGDYEIKFIEESGFILPAQVGIVPTDGDEIILFNLRMPEEYIASSQQELAEAAYAEIDSKYTTDLNNYTLSSNPVAFDANGTFLPIGQMVEYYNGDYCYTTRVIKVTRKLDFPCEQEIVIGNTKIKGNTATLKEEVVNANSNIDVLTQLNQLNQQVTQAYQRTTQMILDSMGKAAQYWTEHPTLPNTITTKYNVLVQEEITSHAKGNGDGSGSGSGNGKASYLHELLDVEIGNPAQGQVLMYDHTACNGIGGWVARTIQQGLDEGALAVYLATNNYAKRSDIPDVSRFVTLDYLNLQGYLTEHQDISHLLPRVEFDDMFERVERPDGSWRIRAKADFEGVGEIISHAEGELSGGMVSGNATSIGGYEVVLNTLRDGDVLVWNGSKWVNRAAGSGGLDESSLAAYLLRNEYVTAADLAGYAPLSALDKYLYHRRGQVDIDAITDVAGGLYESATTTGTLPFDDVHHWHKIFDWGSDDPGYRVQLATTYTTNGPLYLRHKTGGSWHGWREILDSNNYAALLDSRYVNAAGDTMNGNLTITNNRYLYSEHGIVAGGSSLSTYLGNNNVKTLVFGGSGLYADINGSRYSIWHAGNDGHSSGLDADLLDGREGGGYLHMDEFGFTNGISVIDWAKQYVDWNWLSLFSSKGWSWAAQLNMDIGNGWTIDSQRYSAMTYRCGSLNNTWNQGAVLFLPTYRDSNFIYLSRMTTGDTAGAVSLNTIRFADYDTIINGNVASASKLQTARNIYGVAWDGSSDLNGAFLWHGGEATLRIYQDYNASQPSVYGQETLCLQSTFDGQEPLTCPYPSSIPDRNVMALQPRGGRVAIGKTSAAYALDVVGGIITDGWFRSWGSTGWYNETHGGGIYMSDSTYVRVSHSKAFFVENNVHAVDFIGNSHNSTGNPGSYWHNGWGCFAAQIYNNGNQTPLLLAYREGAGNAAIGTNRLFAMELLNDGATLNFGFGGVHRFEFTAGGNFIAAGEITNHSDRRLKSDIKDFAVGGRLHPVTYIKDGHRQVGLIAQDVQDVCPAVVHEGSDPERLLSINYSGALCYALAGVYSEIDDHEARIRRLEKEIKEREESEL